MFSHFLCPFLQETFVSLPSCTHFPTIISPLFSISLDFKVLFQAIEELIRPSISTRPCYPSWPLRQLVSVVLWSKLINHLHKRDDIASWDSAQHTSGTNMSSLISGFKLFLQF